MTKNTAQHTVLIATDNMNEAGYIAEALEVQGYNTIFCEFDGQTLKGTPVTAPEAILIVFTDYIEKSPAIIKALKKPVSYTHLTLPTTPYV